MTLGFHTIGIESSCDETAVAVLRGEKDLLSSVIYSQAEMHARYGGVVPEVASRDHLRKLPYLVRDALLEAKIDIGNINLVAATYGPGLVGPLLVGLSYGKGMAYGLGKPFIGVNHLEGHIFAQRLCDSEVAPPFMALIVSGGHTLLVDVASYGEYHLVGMTLDDAVIEAQKYFNITYSVTGDENVPKNKRYIFVSNHPMGGIDGVIIMKHLNEKYGPTNTLVNDFIMAVYPLKDWFLPINKLGGQARSSINMIEKLYDSDKNILIFPAGLCSRKINTAPTTQP